MIPLTWGFAPCAEIRSGVISKTKEQGPLAILADMFNTNYEA